MLFVFGICAVSANAAAMPYCVIPKSEKPVKIGNSYVWQPSDREIKIKKSKNSTIQSLSVKGEDDWISGITDGTTVFYSMCCHDEELYRVSVLGKYSIATEKNTEYKRVDGHGLTVWGYHDNKIFYYLPLLGTPEYPFYSFDIKTKKIKELGNSVPNDLFYGAFAYGDYILGSTYRGYRLEAYNVKTKKFTTLSIKGVSDWGGGYKYEWMFDKVYGGYYYYAKYIAKASEDMDKYKIYKFNLKTGKSIPVSKTFTASMVLEITDKKVRYINKKKYFTLKY